MPVNVDPSVSLLISSVRNAHSDSHFELMMYEMKKMAAKNYKDDDSLKFEVWKKLYLQSKGIKVNVLDFVKASASPSLFLKRMGYQGLLESDCTKQLILMPNTLSKDLETEKYANEALIFLSNIHDKSQVLIETALKIEIPKEDNRLYPRSIIAKSKYSDDLLFSIVSSRELHLFAKLQIALDKNLVQTIADSDIEFLRSTVFGVKCPFTKLKILQTLYKAFMSGKLVLGDKLVLFLKDMTALPLKKAKKQIEVGLAIEATKLLIVSRNLCERVEEFIFRLINSDNMNSKYLGFKLISKYRAIPEIAINRIIELGISKKLYLSALVELIDRSNYQAIYRRMGEFSTKDITRKGEDQSHEESLNQLLSRLCDFGDQEFICKVLYEHSKFYTYARRKDVLIREQSKILLKRILCQNNSDYFPMIYDLFPAKTKSCEKTSSLCSKHLNILITSQKAEDGRTLDYLADFMCTNGDIVSNREMLRDVFSSAISDANACLARKLVPSILAFNIVLPNKLFHIRDDIFVEYTIGKECAEIKYPSSIREVEVLGGDPIGEKKEGSQTIKTYQIRSLTEIEILVTDQGKQYKKVVHQI